MTTFAFHRRAPGTVRCGLAASAILLAACGGASGEDPTATGGAGAITLPPEGAALPACPPDTMVEPPHTDVVGVYSVPVPPELTPYASYPIDSITACRRANRVELGYRLPALLVGKPARVSFEGSYDADGGVFALSGDGTATCEVVDGSWSCLEHFVGITVDLEEVAKEVENLPLDVAEGRLDVAAHFGGDPIGILDFTP